MRPGHTASVSEHSQVTRLINDASISPVTADLARDCLKNWISQGKVPPPPTTQRDLLHLLFVPYGVNVKKNLDLAQNSGAIQQFHDNGGLANQLWDFVPVGPPAP